MQRSKVPRSMSAKLKGFMSFCDNKQISGGSDFFTDVNTKQSEHWPRARTEKREFLTCCETTSQEETSRWRKWILKQDSQPFSCVIYLLNPPSSTCRVLQRGNQIRLQGRSVREMKNELVTPKKQQQTRCKTNSCAFSRITDNSRIKLIIAF